MKKDKIAIACERAYRRGFQHGVNASEITDHQAAAYRYEEDPYTGILAPEKYADGIIRCGSPIENRDLLDDEWRRNEGLVVVAKCEELKKRCKQFWQKIPKLDKPNKDHRICEFEQCNKERDELRIVADNHKTEILKLRSQLAERCLTRRLDASFYEYWEDKVNDLQRELAESNEKLAALQTPAAPTIVYETKYTESEFIAAVGAEVRLKMKKYWKPVSTTWQAV